MMKLEMAVWIPVGCMLSRTASVALRLVDGIAEREPAELVELKSLLLLMGLTT